MKSLFLTSLLVVIAACSHNETKRDIANVKAQSGVRTINKHLSVKVVGGLQQATHTLYDLCAREAIKNNAITESHSLDILSFKDGSRRRHPSDLEAVCTYKEKGQRRCSERSIVGRSERTISCTRSEKRVEYTGLDGCPTVACVKRVGSGVGSCSPKPHCRRGRRPVELERYSNGCPQYRCEAIRAPVACPTVQCRPGQIEVPGAPGQCPTCK